MINPKIIRAIFLCFCLNLVVPEAQAVPARCHYGSRALRCERGDTGNMVSNIQQALIAAGYFPCNETTEGVFGPNTERTVRRFQYDHGLTADGIVGRRTYSTLIAVASRVGNCGLNF